MVSVRFYGKTNGEFKEHVFKLSRVPCVGERITVPGSHMIIKTVEHIPFSEANSIAAFCHFECA